MMAALQLGAGLTAACGGWLATRAAGRARLRAEAWLLLDALLPAAIFALLLLASGRPLFSGALTLGIGAGFGYAERAKRSALGEPIVFTDVFQTFDIFRHPQLATPFPNRLPIVLSVLGTVAAFAALFRLEPALPGLGGWAAPAGFVAVAALACWLAAGPLNAGLARALRAAGMRGEPFDDAARFGTLATLVGYGIVARAERAERAAQRAGLGDQPPTTPPQALSIPPQASTRSAPPRGAPVLLVQCESFFDARRLGDGVVADLLPCFDRLQSRSLQWGRLDVPCWGANTVRTEFEVLSGLAGDRLGMDRFNPYHRYARRPVASVASRLRQRGYRTICVHPFDRRFYARDRVLPQLGFDVFLGEEAFTGAELVDGFVADAAIPPVVETLIAEARQPVFVFVITLENHGPWSTAPLGDQPRLAPGSRLPAARLVAFERYLASLRNGDTMLSALAEGHDDGRLVAFYGDHQPGPPLISCRDHGNTSDYLIWQAGHEGSGQRRDLAAHALGTALLARLDAA